jgi:hypothetical protein
MSEIVTLSISAVALGVTGVLATTAAAAIAAAAAGARLSAHGRHVLEVLIADVPRTLDAIGPMLKAPIQDVPALPRHEARLVAELASSARLAAGDVECLTRTLRARPIHQWAGIIRQNHEQQFRQSLTDAVVRTCRSLDFHAIETTGGQLTAQDRGGRALAMQINDDGTINAEVLGVADGSCRKLIDRFLQTLEAEGVRIAKVNDRRWTGGAPQTAVGRGWVSKGKSKAKAAAEAGARRDASTDRRVKAKPGPARIRR